MADRTPLVAAPVVLRPAGEDDDDLLRALFASTRADELAALQNDAQREAFLLMQFHARSIGHHAQYPDAEDSIIVIDGEAIGRLNVDRRKNAVHVVDVCLLPQWRNQGIGTHLLRQVIAATGEGCEITLQVTAHNPARRLYARLGFTEVSADGVYILMKRGPQ